MIPRRGALLFGLTIAVIAARAWPGTLPIYIEDNHGGSFYWLARQLDIDQPCTLVHFDAHSDASGIFDSDKIRTALRGVTSLEERAGLLDRWRRQGAIQCFNWIEPLMPAPISRVVWVPGEHADAANNTRVREAQALLDGHLEAAPRQSGPLRHRYLVSPLDGLPKILREDEPLIITIDLDYFSGMAEAEQAAAFDHVWNFAVSRKNLRAITCAISRPYLRDDEEANRLLALVLKAARLRPTMRIQFEPFAIVPNDHSRRAQEFSAAGKPLPLYDLSQASDEVRSLLLAEAGRITVREDAARWEAMLGRWRNETAQLHLELKDAEQSTDGIWRVAAGTGCTVDVIAQPWTAKLQNVEWTVETPAEPSSNVSRLTTAQVGFISNAAARPRWTETLLPTKVTSLPLEQLDAFFDPALHTGSVRLKARANIDGKWRETPAIEIRRFIGTGFRAAVSEQFGLPYLFGSGELSDGSSTGPETNLGADCANFLVYAMRRQGLRIPWSDPKQLRARLELVAAGAGPGLAHFSTAELARGLIVHLGTHVAAVMEDRAPLGVLDDQDLVAHQLKGFPERITLRELLAQRHTQIFDLYRVPAPPNATTILFGGDVMLGRSCADKIRRGVDPFAGIRTLLAGADFSAANLECTIAADGAAIKTLPKQFAFHAPAQSAALLRASGFRAMSLANNHALDFGPDALQRCAQLLRREEVEPVGLSVGANLFSLPHSRKLALLAINDLPGAPVTERGELASAITEARKSADLVICMVHWGEENSAHITAKQRELARWLIDRGVDAVTGSHPHCVQPLDFYHGRPIAYSLGNLVFDGAPTVPSWNRGALLQIDLSDVAKVNSTQLISVILESGLPRPLSPAPGVVAKQ